MSREPVASAILRHAARGMSRRQLVHTYGPDAVLRVLGNDEPKTQEVTVGPVAFNMRLARARLEKKHTRIQAVRVIGSNKDILALYEAGEMIPQRSDLIAALARYMSEDLAALTAELAYLRSDKVRRVQANRSARMESGTKGVCKAQNRYFLGVGSSTETPT